MMHGAREVGPRHSSFEAGEQSGAIRRGVGGAKDGDQGECEPAKHALDSEPGSRVTGAGPHTACLCRHTPEVGAVCGKAARTVLCGGRAMKRASLPLQRRQFILSLGGAAAWPLAARAQQSAMPVVGLLQTQSSTMSTSLVEALRQGLAATGFVEGRNIAIAYRSAQGDVARLPVLATELVHIPVAVIAAVGGDTSVHAAKAATTTIPIVFTTASDPVATGLVASLNRPGGNVTGATFLGSLVATKHVGLLRDMVPKLATVGLLTTSLAPSAAAITRQLEATAQAVGLKAVVADVNGEAEIDTAFALFVEQRVGALVIFPGAFFH